MALGDRVYVTLGITAPLCALDAATGRTIRTYEATKATEEIVLADGVLFLLVDPDKKPLLYQHATDNRGKERDRANREFGWSKESPPRVVMAVSADTGDVLWTHRGNVASLTLAVGQGRVFFYDGQHVVALDRKSGKEAWVSEPAADSAVPATGYAPRLIVVFDDSRVYALFAQNVGNNINPRTYYSLYAADKDAAVGGETAQPAGDSTAQKRRRRAGAGPRKGIRYLWELERPGLLANAMVLAGRNLFLAGPPDVADEEKTYGYVFGADDEINRQMRRQEDAWRGNEGALVWAVSADTGQKLSEHKIAAMPVWDGMIAAGGRLYLSLTDGSVLSMGGR